VVTGKFSSTHTLGFGSRVLELALGSVNISCVFITRDIAKRMGDLGKVKSFGITKKGVSY